MCVCTHVCECVSACVWEKVRASVHVRVAHLFQWKNCSAINFTVSVYKSPMNCLVYHTHEILFKVIIDFRLYKSHKMAPRLFIVAQSISNFPLSWTDIIVNCLIPYFLLHFCFFHSLPSVFPFLLFVLFSFSNVTIFIWKLLSISTKVHKKE